MKGEKGTYNVKEIELKQKLEEEVEKTKQKSLGMAFVTFRFVAIIRLYLRCN